MGRFKNFKEAYQLTPEEHQANEEIKGALRKASDDQQEKIEMGYTMSFRNYHTIRDKLLVESPLVYVMWGLPELLRTSLGPQGICIGL